MNLYELKLAVSSNEYDEKMLFVKYIVSEQIAFNNLIFKNMNEATSEMIENARVYLASIFRKNISDIPTDNKTIIKLFCKAGAQHLVPTTSLLENLQYIYANIKNIVQLIPNVRGYNKKNKGEEEDDENIVIIDDDYTNIDID